MAGIIFPYDKSTLTVGNIRQLEKILPFVDMVKVGLEAFTAGLVADIPAVPVGSRVYHLARKHGKGAMIDLKLCDIPNTVGGAMRNIVGGKSVRMATFHASGGIKAMREAVAACKGTDIVPLGVTVLTSIGDDECVSIFGDKPGPKVLQFARWLAAEGAGGIVCSPQELEILSEAGLADRLTKVVPGIRPAWALANDQKRVMTPAEAVRRGATYLVIGRPISQPPLEIGTPAEAARRIREEMEAA